MLAYMVLRGDISAFDVRLVERLDADIMHSPQFLQCPENVSLVKDIVFLDQADDKPDSCLIQSLDHPSGRIDTDRRFHAKHCQIRQELLNILTATRIWCVMTPQNIDCCMVSF